MTPEAVLTQLTTLISMLPANRREEVLKFAQKQYSEYVQESIVKMCTQPPKPWADMIEAFTWPFGQSKKSDD